MRPNPEHAGSAAWAGLAAYVATYDLLGPETLSHAFRRGLDNPRSRYLVLGAWALTTAHLVGLIPEQYDPFKVLTRHTDSGPLEN